MFEIVHDYKEYGEILDILDSRNITRKTDDPDCAFVHYDYLRDQGRLSELDEYRVLFAKIGPQPFEYYRGIIEQNPLGSAIVGVLTPKGRERFTKTRANYPDSELLYREFTEGGMDGDLYLLPSIFIPKQGENK